MRHSNGAVGNDASGKKEEMEWDNTDNNAFYEAIKAEGLKEIAEKGGLASGCDIEKLTPYWINAKSILEVGAGYGRVIDYLLKHQFQGKITAIERCNTLFSYLEKKYCTYENVHLVHGDVSNINDIQECFDVIFHMWSGIADFSQKEQPQLLRKLVKMLNIDGKLIIDTIPENITPLYSNKYGEQLYIFERNKSTKYIYEPNAHEIQQYAKNLGFSNFTHIKFSTNINRERWLYILS